jgi:hypothetical protein
VLIAGGDLMWKGALSDEALVWDAKTGALRKAKKLPDQLMGRFAVQLGDGRPGLVEARPVPPETTKAPDAVFDETSNTWTVGPLSDPTARALHALPREDIDSFDIRLLRPIGGSGGKASPLLLLDDSGSTASILVFDPKTKERTHVIAIPNMEPSAVMLDEHTAVVAGGDEGQTAVLVCTVSR